ncbi:zinc-dependent alcohol dehydrogenase family protein [Heyndrickxia coagulans]|uniref:zinc-dependent alcohol dehydrogenase family protein n=1 Tax=Heyndrickxia coagulans TaxID=1398 RepID=UPI0006287351|nr:zinc-dependent alcohol dehydrogenase family protein [Heyndrickxia coagulans]NWN94326.1 alcohol dehydrogenase catalytic domain-containing protein [Bacillus sp. (in: firmicutes)]
METRVAVLYEMGLPAPYKESQPLKIETLKLEPPKQGELLIKVKAAGLCHSDLSVINGSRPRPMPMALGHEAAGEVIEVGEGITDLKPGDHVVCSFVPSCGHCLPCQEGRPALCEPGAKANNEGEMLSGGRRLKKNGKEINHHLGVSGFAEYAVVSRNSVVKVDPEIPFSKVAIFGCAVITGVGAVINTARVKPGSSVAVVGLGGIGLNALLGAVLAGARKVIAVDINLQKLEIAKKLGATETFDSRNPDVIKEIRSATDGGVDYAFETAGAVPAMETAYRITKRGGMTVTTGLPDPSHQFSFPQVTLTAEERTVKGSYLGSCVPSRDIPRFIELYKQGRLPVDRLLTDTLPFEKINEGFDKLANGEATRLVVEI